MQLPNGAQLLSACGEHTKPLITIMPTARASPVDVRTGFVPKCEFSHCEFSGM
jgi:hypothetical protein